MGDVDSISREFAREYSERLWKQLVVLPDAGESTSDAKKDAMVSVGLAIAAAVAVKSPELFGLTIFGDGFDVSFYSRNFSLFVIPFLAAYFAWQRGLDHIGRFWLAAPFITAALVINVLPYRQGGHTEVLAALHLPIALWLAAGFGYIAGRWNNHD